MIFNLKGEYLSERRPKLRMRQPRRRKYCKHLRLEDSFYSHMYHGIRIFNRKENLTVHNLGTKCAEMKKSEAEWIMIGLHIEVFGSGKSSSEKFKTKEQMIWLNETFL